MAGDERVLAGGASFIDFQTDPSRYRHWKLDVDGDVATLTMDVDENGGLFEGYQLKLNSYDLGVDIEVGRRRAAAALRASGRESGDPALRQKSGVLRRRQYPHAGRLDPCPQGELLQIHQRDAQRSGGFHRENSGQRFITVVNGTAAGGGYELALATDHIILADDGSAAVALPEVPLLAVLPGTGGLTRVVDKRKVRRDHADYFCTIEEGIKGKRAVQWRLVDEIAPNSKLEAKVSERAKEFAASSKRNGSGKGIALTPLSRTIDDSHHSLRHRQRRYRSHARASPLSRLRRPRAQPPADIDGMIAQGAGFWPLQVARELDDAILHLRINELQIAMIVFKSHGEAAHVLAYDEFLEANKAHWLVNEIRQYWKRVLKRIDVTSRTLVALVEPGSCFVGTLAELVLAADRSYMLIGTRQGDNRAAPTVELSALNFGAYPMSHGLTRLESRFQADPSDLEHARERDRRSARCRGGRGAWACDLCARRHRLGRRGQGVPRGARELLARWPHRHGSEPALRRSRDHGIQNLFAPHRLAELDFPAAQCGRRGGRFAPLRHRPEGAVRYDEGLRSVPGAARHVVTRC